MKVIIWNHGIEFQPGTGSMPPIAKWLGFVSQDSWRKQVFQFHWDVFKSLMHLPSTRNSLVLGRMKPGEPFFHLRNWKEASPIGIFPVPASYREI